MWVIIITISLWDSDIWFAVNNHDLKCIFVEQRLIEQPARMMSFLYENTTIVQQPIKTAELTHRIVHDAISFPGYHSSTRMQMHISSFT